MKYIHNSFAMKHVNFVKTLRALYGICNLCFVYEDVWLLVSLLETYARPQS